MADSMELFKTVDLDGEQFIVKKFTAKQGLQVARFILSKATPIIPFLDGSEADENDDKSVMALLEVLNNISDSDVDSLVDKCLKCCYKSFPAGMQAVMDAAGNYGVDGVEYDMLKTVRLCIEAIKWGAADFFGEKGSALIAQGLQQIGFRPSL